MADDFDLLWDATQGGSVSAPDSFDLAWGDSAPATYGSNALNLLKEIPGNIWQGVKNAPSAAYNMVTSIPDGISNLAQFPVDAAQIGADAVKLGYSKLTDQPFIPTGTPEGSKDVYDRAERTLRGIGLIGGGIASGGTALGPILGTSAGFTAYDKLNQVVGNDEETTAAEDFKNFQQNLGTNLAFSGGSKVAGAGAKKIGTTLKELPQTAKALDRKSIQTRQSDYGSTSDLSTILTPEGAPETYVKSALDDLLSNNKLGESRNPADLLKKVDSNSKQLSSNIDSIIKSYDEAAQGQAPKPEFSNALKYIYEGKVPANEIPSYIKRLDDLDKGIKENGQGKLSYVQQQKIAIGKNYSTVDAVKAGFEREVYKDLQKTVEKAVPDIQPLNAELGKYLVAKPIINRALKASENQSPLTALRDFAYTTGGVGAPAIMGTYLGGPVGTAIGAGLGLGTKYLGSPQGQALIAKGLRKIAGVAESADINPQVLATLEKLAKTKEGQAAISSAILDSASQNSSELEAVENNTLQENTQKEEMPSGDPADKEQMAAVLKQIGSGEKEASSIKPTADQSSTQEQLSGLLGLEGGNGSLFSLKNASLFDMGAEMDAAPQVEVREVEDMKVKKLPAEFETAVNGIAEDLNTDPTFLKQVMHFETGGTFDPAQKNKAGSGATGLIQFMPATAKDLTGASDKQAAIKILESMTPVEQLDYVKKYLKPFKGKLDSLEDVYMAVLYPKAVGKDSEYTLFKEGTKAYWQNRGLDLDKDGKITKAEATSKVKNFWEA